MTVPDLPTLASSKRLRLAAILLVYLVEGALFALLLTSVPVFMAARGDTPGAIALVTGLAVSPMLAKPVFGLLVDRFSYRPMGRYRAAIVASLVASLAALILAAALVSDLSSTPILAGVALCVSIPLTVLDVAMDGTAVDLLSDDERARAAGMMYGGQSIGYAAVVALHGRMIAVWGISSAFLLSALCVALVLGFFMLVRERSGERLLPWMAGEAVASEPGELLKSWCQEIKQGIRGVLVMANLLFLPLLMIRQAPLAASEILNPGIALAAGWTTADFTDTVATGALAASLLGFLAFGTVVDRLGSREILTFSLVALAVSCALFALAADHWSQSWVIAAMVFAIPSLTFLLSIATMRHIISMCQARNGAMQFAIFAAISNLGQPLGAAIAGSAGGDGNEVLAYWTLAALMCAGAVWNMFRPQLRCRG